MTRHFLYVGFAALIGLLAFGAQTSAQDKSKTDPAKALIDSLIEVQQQDTGYSGSVSGSAFLPLGQRQSSVLLLGQQSPTASDAMRSLVKLGVKAVPSLLDHLSDDRRTRIVIEHKGPFGVLSIIQDKGEMAEEKLGKGSEDGVRYTVRVGDLCYVALGQIVNRRYTAVRYQPTAIVIVTCVPKSKELREKLQKEWGGLTTEKHRESLVQDLNSNQEPARDGASVRLAYFYPEALEPLALKQIARPAYDGFAESQLIRDQLYPAKSAKERKELVDQFVQKHGAIARDGILWDLFIDLSMQEADEEGRVSPRLEKRYQARECLIDVFGLPATVKSVDRPKEEPLSKSSQARFVKTLIFDRSEKIDQALRDILSKTDDDYLASGCLARLVGRGYDADIEAYLKRRLPKFDEYDRKTLQKYEGKLGWTRLHAAVDLGVADLIEAALNDKLDVNARGRDGRTALHIAAAGGRVGTVERLLKSKADPNLKDEKGQTPLDLAKEKKYSAVVKLLESSR